MAVKVVDASALGALLFGEPESAAMAARLKDAALVAPALLGFELASICLKKLRRHPKQRGALMAAFALRSQMSIDIVGVDHEAAVQLAEAANLTAYDASYLWLAHQLGAELVTLDAQLQAAAAQARM